MSSNWSIPKFLGLGVAASVLMALAAGTFNATTAHADGVTMHNPASGVLAAPCAGCHRIHTAAAADLLKQSGVVGLCNTCHAGPAGGSALKNDAGTGPSVNSSVALRAGGFTSALINTADTTSGSSAKIANLAAPGGPVTSEHDVSDSAVTATIWGRGAGWGTALAAFTCVNCHDPHGGANAGAATFRLLRVQPIASGASADVVVTDETAGTTRAYTTPDLYKPVGSGSKLTPEKINANGYVVVPDDYATVALAEAAVVAGTASGGISAWCAQCHAAYYQETFDGHGPAGTNFETVYQHKAVDTSHAYYCWNPTTSKWVRAGESADDECPDGSNPPSQLQVKIASYGCTKCHAAHGTNATMTAGSTAAAVGDPGTGLNPSSKLLKMNDRGICRKCHSGK